ncbi:M56 family metallopeptidase [Bacillus pseudomycoides]|uniref:Transcriptional regulator n=1 Tax=Bacillus pseudomycoides TaxID=64104 RepID=A0A2C4A7V4_9BACI|nr:M56 family metallopeptidase [Bacillus pseudomycoides]PDY45907.1 transcriptional regulator [Bacillus pseudomycoides]PEA81581.1 transcriptional regulator [Bacillus pseudomycoides]PED05738.1 transcriptional regulator [Bacillus pseudomycoides]PED70628.1 transcriptional regulator [Bacillus pseudomycoides]PEI37404.1 transcriptional regulator [Bacillus pseudomycoides]
MKIDMVVNIYLPRFFDWLIETSLMASVLVGVILCVKVLLRNKLTPRWQYMLWMILIVRLLLPWSPDSSYSIYSLLSYSSGVSEIFQKNDSLATSQEAVQENKNIANATFSTKEGSSVSNAVHSAKENEQTSSNKKETDTTFSFYKIALYIWLLGAIILASVTFVINGRLHFYIKQKSNITDEKIVGIFENCRKLMGIKQQVPLQLAGKISSPTVFCFFRPRVLLSNKHMKVLNEKQLQYIFYHELSHIKRRDVAMNWLMYGLLILNWFNPILWYAYSCMREDQELACDAFALTFIDSEEQIAYGHTIITLLEHYSSYYQAPSLANLSRNKRTLKRRILMIKKFQKKSYRWSALGVIAIVAVASISLLNAHATEMDERQKGQAIEKKEQSKDTVQKAVETILGTPENARKEWGMSEKSYKRDTDFLYLAEKCLTKEEFEQYVQLFKEARAIQKKAMVKKKISEDFKDYDGDTKEFIRERLSQVDNEKLNDIDKKSKPFEDRVAESLTYSVEEAQKHVHFPIKKPAYTVEGYALKKEWADSYFGRKPELVVKSEYMKGKYGYTIYQSQVFEKNKDPLHYMFPWEDGIENYELEGNQIVFVTPPSYSRPSKLKGMKVLIPAKGKNSAYQVVIVNDIFTKGEGEYKEEIDDDLNKAEMEKILLSMLK